MAISPRIMQSSKDEIIALKAQLEEMRFYDQRLLSTVYWSLGVVATTAFLIAGFSWFTNFRLYERDKESLRREISLEIENLRADIKASFVRQKNDLSVSLEEMVSEKAKDEFSGINSRLDRAESDMNRNHIDVSLLEAKIWDLKGIHTNALSVYISALEEALENDRSVYYSSILNGILGIVEHLDWVTTHRMADLEKLFARLPEEHRPSCDNIRDQLKEKLK